jgi:hypothetical protein
MSTRRKLSANPRRSGGETKEVELSALRFHGQLPAVVPVVGHCGGEHGPSVIADLDAHPDLEVLIAIELHVVDIGMASS